MVQFKGNNELEINYKVLEVYLHVTRLLLPPTVHNLTLQSLGVKFNVQINV